MCVWTSCVPVHSWALQGAPAPMTAAVGFVTGPTAAAVNVSATYQAYQTPCPAGSYCVEGVATPCPPGVFGSVQQLSAPRCSGPCRYYGDTMPASSRNARCMLFPRLLQHEDVMSALHAVYYPCQFGLLLCRQLHNSDPVPVWVPRGVLPHWRCRAHCCATR